MPATTTLQELILGVHFSSPLSISVMDLAKWVDEFSDEFSEVQQLPVVHPVEVDRSITVVASIPPGYVLPRILLRSQNGDTTLQLQQDRLILGWNRTTPLGEPTSYPGYDAIRRRWAVIYKRFNEWHETRVGGKPGIRLTEIGYHNAEPIGVSQPKQRLSEVISFIKPSGRSVSNFSASWNEAVDELENFASVSAQVNLGIVPPDQTVVVFNFTGISTMPPDADLSTALAHIDVLHARILDMRAAAIISTSR